VAGQADLEIGSKSKRRPVWRYETSFGAKHREIKSRARDQIEEEQSVEGVFGNALCFI